MTSRMATASMSATATPIHSRSHRAVASRKASLPVRKARVAQAAPAVQAKRVVLAVASRKVRSRAASRVRRHRSTVRKAKARVRVVRRVRQARDRDVRPVLKAARRSALRVSPIRCKRPSALPTRVRAAMRAVQVGKRVPVVSRVAAWTVAAWMACRAVAAKVKSGDFFLRAR